jgi:DNA-binding protein Fis
VHLRHGEPTVTFKDALREAGREYLVRVLEQKRGNITKAAMEAGVHRATFHNYLAKYGVSVEKKPVLNSDTQPRE